MVIDFKIVNLYVLDSVKFSLLTNEGRTFTKKGFYYMCSSLSRCYPFSLLYIHYHITGRLIVLVIRVSLLLRPVI